MDIIFQQNRANLPYITLNFVNRRKQNKMNDTIISLTTTTQGTVEYPKYELSSTNAEVDVFRVDDMGCLYETYSQLADRKFIHANNFDMILWVKRGRGIHYVDFEEFDVNNNIIFFLSSYNLHNLSTIGKPEGYAIVFTPVFLNHLDPSIVNKVRHRLFNRRNGANYCNVTQQASEKLQSIVDRMTEEQTWGHNSQLHNSYNAALLTDFIVTCIRHCEWKKEEDFSAKNQYAEIYSRFIEAVDNYYTSIHTVKEYVELLGTSKNILTKSTKLYEQLSPLEIIDDRIIVEAKRLLTCTSLRIKEISIKLGFEDPSYFNKFFKKITKVTPANFRESY